MSEQQFIDEYRAAWRKGTETSRYMRYFGYLMFGAFVALAAFGKELW
jgi:hypothetical protein